jgi:hypothetical protein
MNANFCTTIVAMRYSYFGTCRNGSVPVLSKLEEIMHINFQDVSSLLLSALIPVHSARRVQGIHGLVELDLGIKPPITVPSLFERQNEECDVLLR